MLGQSRENEDEIRELPRPQTPNLVNRREKSARSFDRMVPSSCNKNALTAQGCEQWKCSVDLSRITESKGHISPSASLLGLTEEGKEVKEVLKRIRWKSIITSY